MLVTLCAEVVCVGVLCGSMCAVVCVCINCAVALCAVQGPNVGHLGSRGGSAGSATADDGGGGGDDSSKATSRPKSSLARSFAGVAKKVGLDVEGGVERVAKLESANAGTGRPHSHSRSRITTKTSVVPSFPYLKCDRSVQYILPCTFVRAFPQGLLIFVLMRRSTTRLTCL
jgi:hypothetical protein